MSLADVVQRYGIRFKKGLGQNLLLDDNINRIMADAAALSETDDVIEVGAGLGALTKRIHQHAGRVLAIEIDKSFMPCLEDQFDAVDNVILFRGDILNHALSKLVDEYLPDHGKLKLISNLPYYITTPILFHFWESGLFFERSVVMVQEEVGLRMVAPVGASDYGRLAIAAKYYAEVDIVHRVPRTCFKPQPRVDSVIVRFRNRREALYPDIEESWLMDIVRAAFAQRRKTLRNTLAKSGALGLSTEAGEQALRAVDIDPGRRPQTLSLDEYAAIARQVPQNAP